MQQLPYYPFPEGGGVKPKVPSCFLLKNGNYYCFDDKGELVYVGGSLQRPPLASLSDYPNLWARSIGVNGIFTIYSYSPVAICGGAGNWGGIIGAPFFGNIVYTGSVNVPVGTSNTYGSAQTLMNSYVGYKCNAGYALMLPIYITITWGGTFASGETVNVQLTFNISQPGSNSPVFTASKVLSATATGSQSLNINDIVAIIAPVITTANTYYTIGSVTVAAASSESSTSVTVTAQAWYLTSA